MEYVTDETAKYFEGKSALDIYRLGAKEQSDTLQRMAPTQRVAWLMWYGNYILMHSGTSPTQDHINENDKDWLYSHWCFYDWQKQYQDYWINEWKSNNPTSQEALFKLLLDDQYASQWQYINNYLSHTCSIATVLPDPNDPLYKDFQQKLLSDFYTKEVPKAGAVVKWYLQFRAGLSAERKIQFYHNVFTRAPGAWISIGWKKTEEAVEKIGTGLNYTGTLAVAGILGVGVIVVASRFKAGGS